MTRTVSPRELETLLASDQPPLLLDVRRTSDYDQDPAMIPDAIRQDPNEIEHWASDLPAEREVVIYCVRGGSVSNSVLDALLERDIPARFIEGGIEAWKQSGGTTKGS